MDSGLELESPAAVEEGKKAKAPNVKRDFFGRVIEDTRPDSSDGKPAERRSGQQEEGMVWVSFHEGSSTAVRKPITLEELMRGF